MDKVIHKPVYITVPSVEYDHTVVFGVERLVDVEEELQKLFEQHWDEVQAHIHGEQLDVNYEYGKRMEDQGRMVLFTVRDGGGVLVGDALFTLGPNPRSKEYFDAEETTFFLAPSHRGGEVVAPWIHYILQSLTVMGVDHVNMTDRSPSGGYNLSTLYGMFGFKPLATVYVAKLGD